MAGPFMTGATQSLGESVLAVLAPAFAPWMRQNRQKRRSHGGEDCEGLQGSSSRNFEPRDKRRRTSMSLLSSPGKKVICRDDVMPTPQRHCGRRRDERMAQDAGGRFELSSSFPLAILAAQHGGPYFTIASFLDMRELCKLDASCPLLRQNNSIFNGPWHVLGTDAFFGMELDMPGGYQLFKQAARDGCVESWKQRCSRFRQATPTFASPFTGSEILHVENPDEVAYCRCRLRSDVLASNPSLGIYVEVQVINNVDNLSFAVVDFEGGGRSSVTFSPETGAVLRERKVTESPRAIQGTYIHLLPSSPPGRRFEGSIGIYLQNGQLAFFRRWATVSGAAAGGVQPGQWESTNFCSDLRWSQGNRLSLCMAFRDQGNYKVRISKVSNTPPSMPTRSTIAYQESKWSLLYGDDEHPLAI